MGKMNVWEAKKNMAIPNNVKLSTSTWAIKKKLMESMNLRVKLPMILEVDNKGAVDLKNNFSVGGRTRHMETRQYYLRKLEEKNIMVVKWKAGAENSSDMVTKNLPKKELNKHAAVYVGSDEYMVQV